MEQICLCLYSRDAKKLADFYAKIFCSGEPELKRFDVGLYYYRCSLSGDYLLDIFESSSVHEPGEVSYSTYYPEMVYRKLVELGCKIENAENIKKRIDAEDIDGNKLHIIGKEMRGLTVPIIM